MAISITLFNLACQSSVYRIQPVKTSTERRKSKSYHKYKFRLL